VQRQAKQIINQAKDIAQRESEAKAQGIISATMQKAQDITNEAIENGKRN